MTRDASPTSADEFDRLRRRVFWAMPSGLYVLGTRAGEQRNLMTLNWATQVSSEPKQLGVGVLKSAFTHELLLAGGLFTLNFVRREDRALVRKFVKPAPWDAAASTLNGVGVHEGRTGAPILDDALAFLECEVRQVVDTGDHSFFIGEVLDAGFPGASDTEVLRMEDTRMNYGG